MGWVSTYEDIEELRHERQHFLSGYNSVIRRLNKTRSLKEVKSTKQDLERLVANLTRFLERKREEAQKAFDEAERFLTAPSVLFAKQLEKKANQLSETRAHLEIANSMLAECRQVRDQLRTECDRLRTENTSLRASIESLKHNEVAWRDEIGNVNPIRKP